MVEFYLYDTQAIKVVELDSMYIKCRGYVSAFSWNKSITTCPIVTFNHIQVNFRRKSLKTAWHNFFFDSLCLYIAELDSDLELVLQLCVLMALIQINSKFSTTKG